MYFKTYFSGYPLTLSASCISVQIYYSDQNVYSANIRIQLIIKDYPVLK